jgi:MerR family transcriptional regulator, copper efflux regulator
MGEELLTIGELAARTGVATSALRYYEELGLVCSATRVSGHRRYPPEAVGTVGAILFFRDVGFTLGEIGRLMASRAQAPRAWHDLARRKLEELDERIREAEVAKVAVEHALDCPRDDIVTCPNFQEVVRQRLAGKRLEEVRL